MSEHSPRVHDPRRGGVHRLLAAAGAVRTFDNPVEYLFEVFTDDDRILETLPVELDLTPLGAGFRGPGNEDLLLTFGDSTSVKIRIGIDESEPPVNRQRRRDAAVLVEVRVDLPVQGIQIEPLGHLKQAEQAAVFNRLGLCDPRPRSGPSPCRTTQRRCPAGDCDTRPPTCWPPCRNRHKGRRWPC